MRIGKCSVVIVGLNDMHDLTRKQIKKLSTFQIFR